MANRKSKSGGQSQGPKQAAGGGASQSPNPQATNKPRSVAAAHPKMMGNASSKPPASSGTAAAPRPPQPQPQANAPRLSNGTKRANGSNFVRAEATSGHRASQDRSVNQGTPKRNESGLNNGPQKVQRPSPQPNISSKNAAPKPKHSQAFFGGQSSASNSAPPSPPRPGNVQYLHVPKVNGATISGNKVFQDPSPRSKQSGHTQPRAQTAQNHTPTPRKDPTFFSASPAHQQQSGKNTASNTFPKVQVATTQAQRPSRGGQSSAPLVQDSGKPSLKSQQQHKAPPHESRLMQETSGKRHTPPKPSTNEGKPPMGSALSTVFSLFSTGSEAPGNPSPKSQHAQQGRAPPHSRLAQETSSKGHKNTPAETPTNDQGKGQPPTEWVLPKVLSSFFSTESKAPGNPSLKSQHAQLHTAPPPSRPVQEIPNKGHKDTPAKSVKNNERQGHPPAESVPPKVLSSFFSTESKGSGNLASHNPQQAQQHRAPPHPRPVQEIPNEGHKDTPAKSVKNNERQGHPPAESVPPKALSLFFSTESNPSHKPQQAQQHRAPAHPRPLQEMPNKGHKNTPTKTPMNDQGKGQPPTEWMLPKFLSSFFSTESKAPGNPSLKSQHPQQHRAPAHPRPMQEMPNKGHKDTPAKSLKNNERQGPPPAESMPPKVLSSIFSTESKGSWNPSHKPQQAQQHRAPPHSRLVQEIANKDHKNTPLRPPMNDRPQGQFPTESVLPTPKVSPSNHFAGSNGTGNQLVNFVIPPGSTHNSATVGSGSVHPRAAKKQGPNVVKPALSHAADCSPMLSKPQAAAVHRLKQFQVRSSSSKALSQHDPKKKAAVRKDLLRQRTPTLRWRESDTPRTISAYSTLSAAPLPSPPRNEFQNKVARKTISQNPDLFKVVSPIKVDVFKKYVEDHPNQSFVQSVARAVKKGFWPWADTSDPSFPTTYDGSRQGSRITSEDKVKFIRQQCEDEMALERWSKPFGSKLLPGMHSAPINAVPKSTPGKFRLIVDQSRGPHALNSTISKSQVKVQLDNIHDLGDQLLAARKKYPNRELCLFKSDVKSAYRQLPMHPLWQIKQAVPINGQYHIDRCNTFGNRGGGWNWDSFISTVNWIATEKKGVSGLLGYVDDNFGWEFKRNKQFYKPYNKHLPTKQARLLELWDELGIPHDEEKQLSGPSLPILGYHVDAKAMTVKVPDEKKAKVVELLRSNAQAGKPYTLNELQSVAGSVGGALSLYPRLRPGLRVLFNEMMEPQEGGTTKRRVTKPVARSLSSLADFLEHAPPVPIRHQKEKVRGIVARTK